MDETRRSIRGLLENDQMRRSKQMADSCSFFGTFLCGYLRIIELCLVDWTCVIKLHQELRLLIVDTGLKMVKQLRNIKVGCICVRISFLFFSFYFPFLSFSFFPFIFFSSLSFSSLHFSCPHKAIAVIITEVSPIPRTWHSRKLTSKLLTCTKKRQGILA